MNRTRVLLLTLTIVFLILYLISAFLYPGGSKGNPQAEGFDWFSNYFCHMFRPIAFNGQVNIARPWALSALGTLVALGGTFWYFLPIPKWGRSSGTIAMLLAIPIFTNLHDPLLYLAGVFGFTAIVCLLLELRKRQLTMLVIWGGLLGLLYFFNYLIDYTLWMIQILPVLQKVTFALTLAWMLSVTRALPSK